VDLFERIHLSGSIIVDSFALILQLQVKDKSNRRLWWGILAWQKKGALTASLTSKFSLERRGCTDFLSKEELE